MSLYLDRAIMIGLMAIIVFTALLHGAVEPWSVLLMELMISFLMLLWGIKVFIDRGLKLVVPATIWPMMALTALGLAQSIAFMDNEGIWRSLSFDVEATRGTVIVLVFVILFSLLSAGFLISMPRLLMLARFLTIYGFLMAFLGVLQYFTEGHTLNWWRSVEAESFGSFVNRNHFAGYMELLFPWPIVLIFARRGHIGEQLFYGFSAAWIGAAAVLTLSRGGMISIISELMLLGILSRYLTADLSNQPASIQAGITRAARLVRPGLMAAIALAIILGVFWLGAEPVINRIATGNANGIASPSPLNNPGTGRLETWRDTWNIIRANPIIGTGLGAYETAYPIYARDNGLAGVVAQAHNDYLQVLADGGIVGGMILLWFIVIICRAVRRGLKTPADPFLTKVTVATGVAIFSILVHSLFDFNMQLPSHALLFGLLSTVVSQINATGLKPLEKTSDKPNVVGHWSRGRAMTTSFSKAQRVIRKGISALFLATLVGALSQGSAQQPRTTSASPQTAVEKSAPSTFVPPDENNRISPGDTLTITIDDAPELSKSYHVSAAGTILLPFLGAIMAQRLTTETLARNIAEILKKEDYLKKPQVTISVSQYHTDSYFVQGSVRSPGVYLVRSQPSLFWLISLAGGLTENHGSVAIILRPIKPQATLEEGTKELPPTELKAEIQNDNSLAAEAAKQKTAAGRDEYEMIKINLTNIYQGRFDQNLKIEPGDIVHIPPANVFFVAGEVNAPGSFQLKDGTTLRQAISLAQGTTFKARLGDTRIFRDDTQTGKREEIKVDVGAVMSGKKEDIPIFANDIIIIPNSKMKSIGGSLLMTLGTNAARFPIR